MTTWSLGTFSSYELGRVAEVFRAEVAVHPHAPATHVLRQACLAGLLVDQRFSDPWSDPTFLPRFQALRDRLLEPYPERPATDVEASEVVNAIEDMIAELEARDA